MDDTTTDEITVTGVLPAVSELGAAASPDEHADVVGLTYVEVDDPGIRRVRRGRGFSYVEPDGSTLQGDDRTRIEALAIPPAWEDVWICPDPRGHVQATGIDAAGRKQYRYHPRWRSVRDATKFHRMGDFVGALPRIRDGVDADLRRHGYDRRKMVALVVALLDETLIRIGTEHYARTNGAHGLTTLQGDHVEVSGTRIRFSFPGKSGQERELELRHRRLARQLLRCEEVPGQRLFAYEDGDGWREVDSGAVNRYLRDAAGEDLTAKDFRTWGASVVVAEALRKLGRTDDEDGAVLQAVDAAAERLGNTRAVARSSYVDPRVIKAYRFGRLLDLWDDGPGTVDRLSPAERAVRRVLDLELPPSSELTA